MSNLLEGVRDFLSANIKEINLTFGENLFINFYPDDPKTIVSVIDLGGAPPSLYFPTREKVVEIKFRAVDQSDGYKLGSEIFDLIHSKENYYFGDLRVLHSLARTDVNYLFQDKNDRSEFSIEIVFLIQN
ncbi:minor capsid protein [Salipaludibacillus sp. HK11]|uniref:minor capsid protein n=1 Tax=Salipaludibacillus sp. HK11 TaxID=3394320 RepID=UPI0039FCD5B8